MGAGSSNTSFDVVDHDYDTDDDLEQHQHHDTQNSSSHSESDAFLPKIKNSIASSLGYDVQPKSEFQETLEGCCPALTWQQRLWGFGICMAFGMMLSYMSGFYIARPGKFAVLYTMGNLFALGSTTFLMGPLAQIKRMFHPDRAGASVMYLGIMLLTVVVAKKTGKVAFVIPLIFLQWIALIWYSLSYIPFGRRILKSIVSFCCSGIC
mmetsp:Transcript_29565/g.51915  ORF Transcript_29565/g.51915 Transcript_29565/m.51915 type:complete len:208 (-) Transcript_29565:203-826(-)